MICKIALLLFIHKKIYLKSVKMCTKISVKLIFEYQSNLAANSIKCKIMFVLFSENRLHFNFLRSDQRHICMLTEAGACLLDFAAISW